VTAIHFMPALDLSLYSVVYGLTSGCCIRKDRTRNYCDLTQVIISVRIWCD